MSADPALDALFVPLANGAVRLPLERTLFLRARLGEWLYAWPRERFLCDQTFKPFADSLARAGAVIEGGDATADLRHEQPRFPLVLVLPPRQRDEARALLAGAVRRAAEGGIVIAAQANNEGAGAVSADLERLVGPLQHLSKHKCRVVWTTVSKARIDKTLTDEWSALDAPRPILDGRLVSRPGLFAWDRIDPASALLASLLPPSLAGRVADLGAGYGYLSTEIIRRCAAVTSIDLYDAEHRALEPARVNVRRAIAESTRVISTHVLWHDVSAGMSQRYDAIVSNPPFHQGRVDQPELGQAFISAAAKALESTGTFWMVANRHLPYEATLSMHFAVVRTVEVRNGFKVIEAREPRR